MHNQNLATQQPSSKGFTLLELMVAMTVTLFIVGGLIAVTSSALGTLKQSTGNVRGFKQAKTALDQISLDLESLVVRSGNDFEWLAAEASNTSATSADAYFSRLVFLTAAIDRYDGDISQPGDISCVQYEIAYQNPISGRADNDQTDTFVLYRKLYNPGPTANPGAGELNTFDDFLNKPDPIDPTDPNPPLAQGLLDIANGINQVAVAENFVCENIREMTLVFHISYTNAAGNPEIIKIPIINASSSSGERHRNLKITGQSITASNETTNDIILTDIYPNARITAIDINLQIIDDSVVPLTNIANTEAKVEQGVKRFTKTIYLPQL